MDSTTNWDGIQLFLDRSRSVSGKYREAVERLIRLRVEVEKTEREVMGLRAELEAANARLTEAVEQERTALLQTEQAGAWTEAIYNRPGWATAKGRGHGSTC